MVNRKEKLQQKPFIDYRGDAIARKIAQLAGELRLEVPQFVEELLAAKTTLDGQREEAKQRAIANRLLDIDWREHHQNGLQGQGRGKGRVA